MTTDWTPQVAEELAGIEGIALSEKHWCVIASSRELAARNGRPPSLGEVCSACGVTLKEVKALFPGQAAEVLARLTGATELERTES
ncbi:MAG: TusE/DsrC/DsvC family sulfur relay protein [Acidobacteriota bacterium]